MKLSAKIATSVAASAVAVAQVASAGTLDVLGELNVVSVVAYQVSLRPMTLVVCKVLMPPYVTLLLLPYLATPVRLFSYH